ncbi:MAG: hypothetical protein AAFR76_10320, partial [Planctomycetota bacterium]
SLIRYTARNVRGKYKCWRKTAYTRADTPHEYQLLLEAHRMMYAMLKRVGDCAASPAKEPVRGSLKIGNRTVVCEQCEDGRDRHARELSIYTYESTYLVTGNGIAPAERTKESIRNGSRPS